MDVVARTFRDACPTGIAELSHLREALLQIAQERISVDAINLMLEDAAQGEKSGHPGFEALARWT